MDSKVGIDTQSSLLSWEGPMHRRMFILLLTLVSTTGLALVFASKGLHLAEVVAVAGEALFVAGVLGLTVDSYLKRRLTSEVFESALRAALGKDLPQPLRAELYRIGSCGTVREHFEADFLIDEHENGHVALSVRIRFDVRNLTRDTESFEQILRVRQLPGRGPGKVVSAKCTIGSETIYDESNEAGVVPFSADGIAEFRGKVDIPPLGTARFSGELRRIMPSEWGDVFYFTGPTIGVSIRAFAPRHQVTVHFNHEDNARVQRRVAGSWDLPDSVFLPNTSYEIQWSRSADQAP